MSTVIFCLYSRCGLLIIILVKVSSNSTIALFFLKIPLFFSLYPASSSPQQRQRGGLQDCTEDGGDQSERMDDDRIREGWMMMTGSEKDG